MTYKLTTTKPDGTVKIRGGLTSQRKAASAVFHVLTEYSATSARQATAIAFQAEYSSTETDIPAFGYVFRIETE